MSWSRIRDALKMTEIAIEALEVIRDLTQVSSDRALDAMQAIAAIIESLRDGFMGKTTPDLVRAELRAIRDRVFPTSNVDDKFDPSDSNHGG